MNKTSESNSLTISNSLVVSASQQPNDGPAKEDKNTSSWPNDITVINCTLFAFNLLYEVNKIPLNSTMALNVLIRLQTIKDPSIYRKILKVVALATLFIPHGRITAMVIDCIAEGTNFYFNQYQKKPSAPIHDEKVGELLTELKARKLLNVPEDCTDIDQIREHHQKTIQNLTQRKTKAQSSPVFAQNFEKLIENADHAFNLLMDKYKT